MVESRRAEPSEGESSPVENYELPDLEMSGTNALEAWFLGPKAENAEILEELVLEALRDHVYWRRNYHPGDPSHISEKDKRTEDFRLAYDRLKENFRLLLAALKKSAPFFSMRYQGHMNWEVTLPGIVGYFAAMLYNPNNVAFEASTATTFMEIEVSKDICRMLGYRLAGAGEQENDAPMPWGHITCDGTVANIEALWAARNLKYYPLAVKMAAEVIGGAALTLEIEVCGENLQKKKLGDLTPWELVNIPSDEALKLPERLINECSVDKARLAKEINACAVQEVGIQGLAQKYPEANLSPKVLVTGTKHYSFPKAVALLGLGAHNLTNVTVDEDARMDIDKLDALLTGYLVSQTPVMAVVCVMGSTEESAVDDLQGILELRNKYRQKGLDFYVHADAAWGGYHACTVRDDIDVGLDLPLPQLLAASAGFVDKRDQTFLSYYVQKQLLALGQADSITVDPHKSGYIPYPAGALCYRNGEMRHLVSISAPYIIHDAQEATVGIFGVEGSKPGAAPASVFLSHSIIRPSRSGYGKIINGALLSCKKVYCRLMTMETRHDSFRCVPVPRLPSEQLSNADVDAAKDERQRVENIDRKLSQGHVLDDDDLQFLSDIGPDLNILTYAFNFKTEGRWNRDLAKLNKFNSALYKYLSIQEGQDIYNRRLIVSTTDFTRESYGDKFFKGFVQRLDVDDSSERTITVLRSVIMDPWITETHQGSVRKSFLDVLEKEFERAITEVLRDPEFKLAT